MKKHESLNYLWFFIKKLSLLSIVILILHLIIIFSISELLDIQIGIEIFVALLPLITFLLFALANIKNLKDALLHCKYNPLFPFYFQYDPNPVKDKKRINITAIKDAIKPCDILLRRYNRYIDGFIFSDKSYFTHVGIYVGEYNGHSSQVLHSTSKDGVHAETLNKFCKCNDVAIFRFSFEKMYEEDKIHQYIIKQKTKTENEIKLQQQEKLVFETLMQKVKPQLSDDILEDNTKQYCSLILERAKSLIKTPYDFNFNFSDFTSLSCIEYVWYCFKCLFPLHRIRVKDFEFFGFIKMPVIVPDVFIKNDYFKYIYSSIPNVDNKQALIKYIKKGQWQLWKFVCMFFVWDAIILFFYYTFFIA